MKKNSIIVGVCLLFFLVACQTSNSPTSGETVKFGAILHFTGSEYGVVAEAMREGIDLAVAEQNNRGGIDGKKIEVIYEDDHFLDLRLATSAAQKLISVDTVSAVFISTYMETMGVGPLFEEQRVPLIGLWDSSSALENIGEYVFNTGTWTESAGARIATYAYDDLGVRSVAIIGTSDEWSIAVSDYFIKEFVSKGGTIVFSESVPYANTNDFRSTIAKAAVTHPDAYFSPLGAGLDVYFKQMRTLQPNAVLLAADSLTPQAIANAEGAADGVYYATLPLPENEFSASLREKYVAVHGHDSDLLLFVGLGYDGARVVLSAMESHGTDAESVKNGLYAVKDVPGAFGPLTMNEKGSAPRYESIFVVKDGKEVFVTN